MSRELNITFIKNDYLKIANKYSADNERVNEFLFYVALAQKLNHRVKIQFGGDITDVRLHFFWTQNSRSGKGQSIKAFKKLCKELGLRVKEPDDFTTATFFGTINSDKEKHNLKKNLDPDNPEYRDPINYGMMDSEESDVVIINEAKALLMKTRHTLKLLTLLQKALDYPGIVTKKLGSSDKEIVTECTGSLIGTTFWTKEIQTTVAEQGFFQRCILYMRDMTPGDRNTMRHEMTKMLKSKVSRATLEKDLKNIAERINKVYESVSPNTILTIEDASLDYIDRVLDGISDKLLKEISGVKLDLLYSFIMQFYLLFIKFGAILAVFDKSTEIKVKHVKASHTFIKKYYASLINDFIIALDEEDLTSNEKKVLNVLGDRKIKKYELKDMLATKLKMGHNSALKLIGNLINKNILQEEREHRTKWISVKKFE